MRHYENLVILKPTLTQEELESELRAIDEIVASNSGEIAAKEARGMRKLAYDIQKNKRGYYYVLYYKAPPASIAEIERRFRINENLLRFMTVKYEDKKEIGAWQSMVDKAQSAQKSASEASKQEDA